MVGLLAGCGDDAADQVVSDTTVAPAPAHGPLPFDLGPGIVRGGDDVVADGFEVPLDGFVDQIADPPAAGTATAHRLVPTAADEQRLREAVATLLGAEPDHVDLHLEGAWFEFHAEGHSHDDVPGETTVPAPTVQAPVDEDAAVELVSAFLTVAGLRPGGEPEAFPTGEHLSVEAPVALVPGVPVLRALVSVTFGPDGRPVGGYGPFGTPDAGTDVDVIDVPTAVRRLALTQRLAGYPTTIPAPAEPVTLVSAARALSLRESRGDHPERWLIPVWRFVDDTGAEYEINAVAAGDLALPD